jgi:hypothetical protein
MNADRAGMLVVYLDVDAGNFKRERCYLLSKLPFRCMQVTTGVNLETCSTTIKVSMRTDSFDRGNSIKFVIMPSIWKRNCRSCYSLYLVSMSVINRSKGKISVRMRDPSGCRFSGSCVLMAVSIIKRGNPAKAVNMYRPSIPRGNIHSMGMQRVGTI